MSVGCLRVGGYVCLTRLHVFALSWPFSIHRGCSGPAIAVSHCRIARSSAVVSTDRPSATISVASLYPSQCTVDIICRFCAPPFGARYHYFRHHCNRSHHHSSAPCGNLAVHSAYMTSCCSVAQIRHGAIERTRAGRPPVYQRCMISAEACCPSINTSTTCALRTAGRRGCTGHAGGNWACSLRFVVAAGTSAAKKWGDGKRSGRAQLPCANADELHSGQRRWPTCSRAPVEQEARPREHPQPQSHGEFRCRLVVLLFLRLLASFHRRARPPRPCRIEQSLAGARENDHGKDVQQQERDPPAPNLHTNFSFSCSATAAMMLLLLLLLLLLLDAAAAAACSSCLCGIFF